MFEFLNGGETVKMDTSSTTASVLSVGDGLLKIRGSMKLKVLIADDHGVVRKGLRLLLEQYPELVVVGEAANGREAVALAVHLSPQVIVMDVAMPPAERN